MRNRIDRINNFRYPVSQPTVFDEQEMTVLELVGKVAYKINETVGEVNNWIDYLDVFVEAFDKNLQDKVIKTLTEWQDSGLLDVIIDEALQTQMDVLEDETQAKLEMFDSQLTQITPKVATSDIKGIWKPPIQTPSTDTLPNDNSTHPDDFYALYDDIMSNAEEGYMTRYSLGKDESGLYDWVYYVLEPESPEKTVVWGSAIHGTEKMGAVILYRFIKLLVEQYDKHPSLAYLRNRIRIVVAPIQNPYGFRNNHRTNVTPVDINRNFSPYWNGWDDGQPKGSAPMSEVETQYINSLLSKYGDTVTYIDIHNTGVGLSGYYCSIPRYGETERNVIHKVLRLINPNAPLKITRSVGPVSTNHATLEHGLNSAIVEWQAGQNGDTPYGVEDTTQALEFIGNLLIQYSTLKKPVFDKVAEPMVKRITTNHLSTSTTKINEWEEIEKLTYTFLPQVDGIVEVVGSFTSHNTNEDANTHFTTAIIQDRHEHNGNTSVTRQQSLGEVYASFGGRAGNLSVNNAARVYATRGTNDDHFGPVEIKFYVKTNNGVVNLRRNKILIKFTPTDKSDQYIEYIEDSAGNVVQLYPPLN